MASPDLFAELVQIDDIVTDWQVLKLACKVLNLPLPDTGNSTLEMENRIIFESMGLLAEMDRAAEIPRLQVLKLAIKLLPLRLQDSGNSSLELEEPMNNDDKELMFSRRFGLTNSKNVIVCAAFVRVPSSNCVAEIIGRLGYKIKALRDKTNTYIKTPVRGEEPVFIVTGRKEDVTNAKREILILAKHFSQIRASPESNLICSLSGVPRGPPVNHPDPITIKLRVPHRVVGLIIGSNGATIKRIQYQTHTYIVSPSRDKDSIFEITGMPENVEAARFEIKNHIALRTGPGNSNSFETLGDLADISRSPYDSCPSSLIGFMKHPCIDGSFSNFSSRYTYYYKNGRTELFLSWIAR